MTQSGMDAREHSIASASVPLASNATAVPHSGIRITLDPAAVQHAMRVEELYSGPGFHPPLRTLP